MQRRQRIVLLAVGLLACVALGAAACGDDGGTAAADRATTTTAPTGGGSDRATTTVATEDGTAAVSVASTDAGTVLVDGRGRVLYAYTPDNQGDPTCVDACADAWPPLLSEGSPTAGSDVDQSLLATVERDDGQSQVSYDGWPLYRFAGDTRPDVAAGQGSGGVWFVLDPQGRLVRNGSGDRPGY